MGIEVGKHSGYTLLPLRVALLLLFLLLITPLSATDPEPDPDPLTAFSDPSRIWGNGVERYIEEAYRACFRTRIIGGRVMNIRMPFAENDERNLLSDTSWDFIARGKGNPDILWPLIEEILDSDDFNRYVETLSDEHEQVIVFNIPRQSWYSSRDLYTIARMKAGAYPGIPHRPYVFAKGKGIEESDVYNYLYCVGLAGMDCSAFVWHVMTYIASQDGLDLGNALRRYMGARHSNDTALYVGTSFYNSRSSYIASVDDRIKNLRPADILLFRGSDGRMAHSAVIQSIDYGRGIIRYLQSTDVAPLDQRGVHESFIRFDPAKTNVSLKDTSLIWTQQRAAPFPGEQVSPFANDGERYRAYAKLGGGRVVRLRLLGPIIEKINREKQEWGGYEP